MSDALVNALVGRPAMVQEYEMVVDPAAYARAFGAGLVDPAGVPSWALNALAGALPALSPVSPESAAWYKRRMQEMRDESPVMAGVGSAVLPSLFGVGGVAAALRASSPSLQGGRFAKEVLETLPYGLGIGAALGKVRGVLDPPPPKSRALDGGP